MIILTPDQFDINAERMTYELDPILKITGGWIAGGAIRDLLSIGKVRKDIDIYHDGSRYDKLLELFKIRKSTVLVSTDRATTIVDEEFGKLDLIKLPYSNPIETIESFDFTLCCAAYDGNKLYMHDRFMIDLADKKLMINTLTTPMSSVSHMNRLLSYGFTIDETEKSKLQFRVNNMSKSEIKSEANRISSSPSVIIINTVGLTNFTTSQRMDIPF